MAKIDLSKYIDNSLRAEFDAKPYDPSKGRKQVLAGIKRTQEQFGAATPSKAPNKWFKATDKIVRFKPKVGSGVLPIGGEEENHIPTAQFPGFLSDFAKAVEAGDFDNEIKAALEAGKAPAGQATGGRVGGGRSEASNLKSKVSSLRRFGHDDAGVRAALEAEGVDKATIDELIAYQPKKKAAAKKK